MNIAVICVAALIVLIAIKRGYRRGITRELKALVSILIALLCLILIILLKRALENHTYQTVGVLAGALIILGTGWRFIKLVTSPLSGFKEIGIVRALDAILGAAAGAVEGVAVVWIVLKILDIAGIYSAGLGIGSL